MKQLFLITLLIVTGTLFAAAQTGTVGIGTLTPDTSAVLDISSNDKAVLFPRLSAGVIDAINAKPGMLAYDTTSRTLKLYSDYNIVTPVISVSGLNDIGVTFGPIVGTIGQTFTAPTDFVIKDIGFMLNNTSPVTVQMKIYSGSGIGGTLLSTTTQTIGNISYAYRYFDIQASNIMLQSGQQYTIIFMLSGTSSASVMFLGTTQAAYNGGSIFTIDITNNINFSPGLNLIFDIRQTTYFPGTWSPLISAARLRDSLAGYATIASLSAYATTTSLSNYATASSLSDYATTASLAGYATVASLSAYATTTSLSNYATTASLSGYATNSSLSGYVTTGTPQNITGLKTFTNGRIRMTGAGDTLSSWGNLMLRADDDNSGAEHMSFMVGNAERARISYNGNVGIGTATPATALDVKGRISMTTTNSSTNITYVGNIGVDPNGIVSIYNANGPGPGGTTYLQGNNQWYAASDRRLKEHIRGISYGLDDVMQLHPVSYNYISDASKRSTLGFIAQEAKEVVPEAVDYNAGTDLYSMSYTELIPILVKAIQEQQAQIAAQKEQIKELQQLAGVKKKRKEKRKKRK